jgi:hypothetical protein
MSKWHEYEQRKKSLQRKAEAEHWSHDKYMEELDKVLEELGL